MISFDTLQKLGIGRLLPKDIENRQSSRAIRMQLFVLFVILTFVCALPYTFLYYFVFDLPYLALGVGIGLGLLPLSILMLRQRMGLNLASHWVCGVSWLVLIWVFLWLEAMLHGLSIWMIFIPVYAIMFNTARAAMAWTALILVTFFWFYIDPVSPTDTVAISDSSYRLLSFATVSLVGILIALLFSLERYFLRSIELENIQEARREAEQASRSKSKFLANTSHEIRTPLNGITGMLRLLKKTELTPKQSRHLEVIEDSAEALLNIVNDVLDLSKIEAEALEFETHSFLLRDRVAQTLQGLGHQAFKKGLALKLSVDPQTPNNLYGAADRLRQIITNLVKNAIKFTDEGHIVLTVEPEEIDSSDIWLKFAVRDTGSGIPEEEKKQIFEAFRQSTHSLPNDEGVGLGLAISKRLVELMDGDIWVESEEKEGETGSTFYFTGRFALDGEDVLYAPEMKLPQKSANVLLATDDSSERALVETTLHRYGIDVTSVSSSDGILDKIRRSLSDEKTYGCLLLNEYSIDSEDLAAIHEIRQNEQIGFSVVLISAIKDEEPLEYSRDLVDAKMLKPIRQSDLLERVNVALGENDLDHNHEETTTSRTDPPGGLSILVAEDNQVNQTIITEWLENRNHDVTTTATGRGAVQCMRKQQFDLVLMDVRMPEMDGLEATLRIRKSEVSSSHTPIAALTAHATKQDRKNCFESGMDEYLTKPIDIDKLSELLGGIDGQNKVKPESQKGDEPHTTLSECHNTYGVAFEAAAETFLEDYEAQLQKLKRSIQEDELTTAERYAHSIKSEVQYFAADKASSLAEQIENKAGSGEVNPLPSLVESLSDELHQVAQSVEGYLEPS